MSLMTSHLIMTIDMKGGIFELNRRMDEIERTFLLNIDRKSHRDLPISNSV